MRLLLCIQAHTGRQSVYVESLDIEYELRYPVRSSIIQTSSGTQRSLTDEDTLSVMTFIIACRWIVASAVAKARPNLSISERATDYICSIYMHRNYYRIYGYTAGNYGPV